MKRSTRAASVLVLAVVLLGSGSCAFYNTFYMARRYYDRAADGKPYEVDAPRSTATTDYNKSIDYAKKLIAQYPKSKLVDDAYLMWARALLGTDDPRQTVKMLEDFDTQFPKSSLRPDAKFYLGVGYRQSRKYERAVRAFDEFLTMAPKHKLAPYGYLEKSRALVALDQPKEAAEAASVVIDRFPKSDLRERALIARAEARFDQKAYDLARDDFRRLGRRSNDDEQRLNWLFRECDCLEAARTYDPELQVLKDAISHEREPLAPDTTGGQYAALPQNPGYDRYGRLLTRIGTVHLMAGRHDEALKSYNRVLRVYTRTPMGAEAQYRIGYAYELQGDWERARTEYGKVGSNSSGSAFATQAGQRLQSLDRLAQFRSSDRDTAEKKAEAAFLLAELYLFQLEQPDRALVEYRKVAAELPGTPQAAKAINAQAWVLSRKFKKNAEADSLFWNVVRTYPATEAQLAARDYLEMDGIAVPTDLIKMPERLLAQRDSLPPILSQPPPTDRSLGAPAGTAGSEPPRLGPQAPPVPGFANDRGRTQPPPQGLPGSTPNQIDPFDNPSAGGGNGAPDPRFPAGAQSGPDTTNTKDSR